MSNTESMMLNIVLLMLFAQNWQLIFANGNVPVLPQNITAAISQSASFACSLSRTSEDVQWLKDHHFIYAGGVIGPLKGRIIVNISSGISNLTISSVKPEDAGEYTCDYGSFDGYQSSAFLTVLEGKPTCKSNMRMDGYIGQNTCGIKPDVVELSCTMKYHGGISPEMTWKKTGDNHMADGNISIVNTGNSVAYILRMEVNMALESSSYSCQTTQLIGNQLSCQSDFISVINTSNSEHTLNKSVGEEVTCAGNVDKNCTYLWKSLLSDGNASELSSFGGSPTNFHLKLEDPGIYVIEEICIRRGVQCALQTIVVNVHETEEYKNLGIVIFGFSVAGLILLVIAIFAGVFCLRRKQRGRLINAGDSRVKDESSQMIDKVPLQPSNGLLRNADQQGNTDDERIEIETSPAAHVQPLQCYANGRHQSSGRNIDQQADYVVIQNSSELIKTIKTEPAERRNKPIYGMAILDDELFIATGWSSNIEVWKLDGLSFSRLFEVKGLVRPFDLVSCADNKCLYTFDFKGENVKSKEIIRVDTTGIVFKQWDIGNDVCQSLSVAYDKRVIFATFEEDVPHIFEYDSEGELQRSVKVKPDTQLNRILHVIKVKDDQFLISHGSIKFGNLLHRVCVAKCERADDGEWVISCAKPFFGGLRGSSDTQLCVPMHMAVNRDGTILVADRENSRVMLLSWPSLTFIREVIPRTENMLRMAFKLCLDDSRGHLFVIDNAELPTVTKWGDGRILVFKINYS